MAHFNWHLRDLDELLEIDPMTAAVLGDADALIRQIRVLLKAFPDEGTRNRYTHRLFEREVKVLAAREKLSHRFRPPTPIPTVSFMVRPTAVVKKEEQATPAEGLVTRMIDWVFYL